MYRPSNENKINPILYNYSNVNSNEESKIIFLKIFLFYLLLKCNFISFLIQFSTLEIQE